MSNATCLHCNSHYQGKPTQFGIYCMEADCRREYRKLLARKKDGYKGTSVKACVGCGTEFEAHPIAKYCGAQECQRSRKLGINTKKQCTECGRDGVLARGLCPTHYSYWHQAKNGRTYPGGTQKLPPRECAICLEPVRRSFRETKVAIHKACREANPGRAYRLMNGTLSVKRKAVEARLAKAAAGTSGGNRVFTAGGCAWCGEYFVAAAGVYCSDSCKTSAKFKRRSSGKSFSVSPRVRQSIYARDKWTCQLCSHPVDKSTKHPSPWAPTLDHIEPQSAALIPDHSPSNLRLAHSWCNSARGDGSNMAKEVLIARATAMHLEAA